MQVSDGFGGVTTSAAVNLTIADTAPTIALSGNPTVPANATYTLTLGAVTDPGQDTVTLFTVHWGDGTTDAYSTNGAKTHVYSGQPAGNIVVDLTDEDGLHPAAGTLAITVTPLNHAPTFTAGTDQAVDEDAGAQSVPNWASGISAGPPSESGQLLTFLVGSTNPALFSAQPAISPSGTLTYTPAANANGIAVVTVRLKDDGGTANGGQDTSAPQTFRITVNAVNDAPTANPLSYSLDEDGTVAVTLTGSDVETPAGSLVFNVVTPPAHGTLTGAGANLVYAPDADYNGPDSFQYTVTDTGDGPAPAKASAPATVSLTINPVNDAPVLTPIGDQFGQVGLPLTFTAVASDIDGTDVLTFSLEGAPAGASIDPATGVFSWTPAVAQAGNQYSFTVRVTDNGSPALSDSQTVVASIASLETPKPDVIGSRSPDAGATEVDIGTRISVSFNPPMNPATLSTSTVHVRRVGSATDVAGSVAYDGATMTFTPLSRLSANTLYVVTLDGSIADANGNALGSAASWTFRTGWPRYSFWDDSATPATPSLNDGVPIEVGTKFRSDVDGMVTGMRFYKGPGDPGTHVGHVWTSLGELLGTVTFTSESDSGWQQATFDAPIAVEAGVTYIVSYYSSAGNYSITGGYFLSHGVDAGPIHALADGVDGGNGLFVYGAGGGFPGATFNSNNYWVDVVFTTTANGNAVWRQSGAADFSTGTLSGVGVTNATGGELRLGQQTDNFDGSSLSSDWSVTPWTGSNGGQPASVDVGGGVASVAGAELLSTQPAGNTPIEGWVDFGNAAFHHFGLATDFSQPEGNYWAVFSTSTETNELFARVNVNGVQTDRDLGALPTGFHLYRVQPVGGGYRFYMDGSLVATIAGNVPSGMMHVAAISAFSGAPSPDLNVDSVTSGAYASSGTFTSAIFDAGRSVNWDTVQWTADVPAGTSLVIEVSGGDTATPDGSWSDWSAVSNGGSIGIPSSRYLRYRVILTSTDPSKTPTLYDIAFSEQ